MSAASAARALHDGDLATARRLIDLLTPAEAPPLRLRLAIALIERDQLVEAIARLEALVAEVPHSSSAWQALAAARRSADDAPSAATAVERAAALQPSDSAPLVARAQIAADRGVPAIGHWRAALAADPGNGDARAGLASALMESGEFDAAQHVVRQRLADEPSWRQGWQTLLTLIHRELGAEAFIVAAREAFDAGPRDGALMVEVLRMLAQAGHPQTALGWVGDMRARVGDSPPLRLMEAEALDELGAHNQAGVLLDQLGPLDHPTIDLARVRYCLRVADPGQAAAIALPRIDEQGGAMWSAYLGTAWRMANDPRWAWLQGDPRLVGAYDLGLSSKELDATADILRALHSGRHPPFQQSMRGGTQTEGTLLSREEPELRRLRSALVQAVRDHVDQLPSIDPTHPFLSGQRGAMRFVGSWSVRLRAGGRHVNHVHSEGWLSSACYIALPSSLDDGDDDHQGWLALGAPPEELKTGLAASRLIRPERGRIVLFPSSMWHGTLPFDTGERLSVAFDIKPLT